MGGDVPIRFGGPHSRDKGETFILAAGVGTPGALLHLPDVSGRIEVASSQAGSARQNATLGSHLQVQGGSVFDGERLRFGIPEEADEPLRVSLEHARISTPTGLQFEARDKTTKAFEQGDEVDDEIHEEPTVVTLGMEEPSMSRRLWLPDESGTILTSDQLSNTPFERLRLQQGIHVEGDVQFDAPNVKVGSDSSLQPSYLSIHSSLSGYFPLSFDCDLPPRTEVGREEEREDGHVCLSLGRPLTEAINTIAFPDTSGTVVTTGNLPNPLISDGHYSISADSLRLSARYGVLLGASISQVRFCEILLTQTMM